MNKLLTVPIAALITMAPHAKAAGCDAVIAAMLKIYDAPVHLYSTRTAGAKVTSNETIMLNNVTYVMSRGRWMKSPVSTKEMRDDKDIETAKRGTCSFVRDEAINGQAATLYKAQTKTEGGIVDTQVWISKSKGVPLKQVNDIDAGGGAVGKSHSETRYEYSNVTAPAIK